MGKKVLRGSALWMTAMLTMQLAAPQGAMAYAQTEEGLAAGAGSTIYVSVDGNDESGDGSRENPYATPQKAQEIIRGLERTGGGITVQIGSGTYVVRDLKFTEEDSGTADFPIVWQAQEEGQTVFTTGLTLDTDDFQLVGQEEAVYDKLQEEAKGHIYSYDLNAFLQEYNLSLPAVPDSLDNRNNSIEGIFIDGSRAVLARWPNEGYISPASVVNPQIYASPTSTILAPTEKYGQMPEVGIMTYTEERIDRWAEESHPIIKGYFRTNYFEEPTRALIDREARTITTGNVLMFGIANGSVYSEQMGRSYSGKTQFFGQNLLCELDAEGEYYIDRQNQILYLYDADNDLSSKTVKYTVSTGNGIEIENASYLSIRGITVVGAVANSISIKDSDNILVENCISRQSGKRGFVIQGGNNCTIRGGQVADAGTGGIFVDGGDLATLTKANHQVENCEIFNVGLDVSASVAIEVWGVGNTVRGCRIHDVPHGGIQFRGAYLLVEKNEIYRALSVTGDAGALYTGGNWLYRGNVLRYNYVHDCENKETTQINAIYLDDSVSDVICYGNVVENFRGKVFHISGGRDHEIYNNIGINCTGGWQIENRDPRIVNGVDTNVTYEAWEEAAAYRSSQVWLEAFPELEGAYVDSFADLDNADPSDEKAMKNLYIPADTRVYDNSMVNVTAQIVTDSARYRKYSSFDTDSGNYQISEDGIASALEAYKGVLAGIRTAEGNVLDAAREAFLEEVRAAEEADIDTTWIPVSNADELKAALNKSGFYYLTDDISIVNDSANTASAVAEYTQRVKCTLDLNGFTIQTENYASLISGQQKDAVFTLRDSSARKEGRIQGLNLALVDAQAGTYYLKGGNIEMNSGSVVSGGESSAAVFHVYEGNYLVQDHTEGATAHFADDAFPVGQIHLYGANGAELLTADLSEWKSLEPEYEEIATGEELTEAFLSTLSANGDRNRRVRLKNDIILPDTIVLKGVGNGSLFIDLNGYTVYLYTDSNAANHSYLTTIQNGYCGSITVADYSSAQTGGIRPYEGEIARSLFSIYASRPQITFIGGTYATSIFGFTLNQASGSVIDVWEGRFEWAADSAYAGGNSDGVTFHYYKSMTETTEGAVNIRKVENAKGSAESGYHAGISSAESLVKPGDVFYVKVAVDHSEDAVFAAGELILQYPEETVSFAEKESVLGNAAAESGNGILKLEDYGEDKTFGESVYVLAFKAIQKGNAEIRLTEAAFVNKHNAAASDLIPAQIVSGQCTVQIAGVYAVTLPDGFSGASEAVEGEDYTFYVTDTNYDYAVTATMGGASVAVRDNGDGSYTIPEVSGDLVISSTRVPKKYSVSFLGTGKDDILNGADTAVYGTDYTFVLPDSTAGYVYKVAEITIAGSSYTGYSVSAQTYTIPGSAVTGDIIITVTKEKLDAGKAAVSVTGDGAGAAEYEPVAEIGAEYTLKLNPELGYSYQVTAVMNGVPVELIRSEENTYVIRKVTGDIIFTIVRHISGEAVEISRYLTLDGTIMWLVRNPITVQNGTVPTYDGEKMFWSEKYGAYCYLIISPTLDLSQVQAKIGVTQGKAVPVDYTGDVNRTGRTDAGDAQLIYNMYNVLYNGFTEEATQEKYLCADVNGDGVINVEDAAAVIADILTGDIL